MTRNTSVSGNRLGRSKREANYSNKVSNFNSMATKSGTVESPSIMDRLMEDSKGFNSSVGDWRLTVTGPAAQNTGRISTN